jgi:hypothetical protein
MLRVLEYEGPRSWVMVSLSERSVKGEKWFYMMDGPCIIREAVIGEMPVVLHHGEDDAVVEKREARLGRYNTPVPSPIRRYKLPAERVYHYIDCPTNNTPAEEPGPCNCDESSP